VIWHRSLPASPAAPDPAPSSAQIAQFIQNYNFVNSRPLPRHKPGPPRPGQGCTFAYPYDGNIPSGQYVTAGPDSSEGVEPITRPDGPEPDEPEVLTAKQAACRNALDIIGANGYTPTGRIPISTVRRLQTEGYLP